VAVELRARPEHPAHQVVAAHRAWVQQRLEQLAAAGGLVDPPTAAEQIHPLVEGAIVRGRQRPAHDGGGKRPGTNGRAGGGRRRIGLGMTPGVPASPRWSTQRPFQDDL
jgi:hypothetical protein